MVERCGAIVEKCANDAKLKVDQKESSRLDDEEQKLIVQNGEIIRNLNEAYKRDDKNCIKKLEVENKEIERQFQEIWRQKNTLPKPGYAKFAFWNYQYLKVPWTEWHYVTPDAVNPLLWFNFFGDAEIQRKPSDEENFIVNCIVLAVTHDESQEINHSEKHIYKDGKYRGKHFQRDEFCRALYLSVVNDGRIARAFEQIRYSAEKPNNFLWKLYEKTIMAVISAILEYWNK